nr:hypothetical protein [Rhizoctonia sp.]
MTRNYLTKAINQADSAAEQIKSGAVKVFSDLVNQRKELSRNSLTKAERSLFTLSSDLKEILIGLILGDLFIEKQKSCINVKLVFKQGVVHTEYLQHLYELFGDFCGRVPKIPSQSPDKRTGKIYESIRFYTFSLPCFLEFYNLFYLDGKKIVPLNIGELLTPLALAYWICDDGSFCKTNRAIIIATNSFSLEEVNSLINVLKTKYNLKCTINRQGLSFRIRISSKSIPVLQSLLKDIMPSMMMHKIGL